MTSEVMETSKSRPHLLDMLEIQTPKTKLTSTLVRRAIERGPMRKVDIGHSRVATWTFGSGPDLVLVHGWPLHAATYRNLVPALSEHFTCHLLDLPGVGQTETTPETPVSLPDHGETLRAVIDGLGLERVALLAHDSGAVVTRLAAAKLGKRVTAMVISGSEIPGHHPWQLTLYLMTRKLPFGMKLFAASLRSRLVRSSPLAFGGCFADPAFAEGDFGELFVRPLVDDASVLAGQSRLLEGFDWSVVDDLKSTHAAIQAPVCLVWGAEDPFFPVRKLPAMREEFAGPTELHAIPNAKLFPHEDHSEAFLGHALPFLQKHAAIFSGAQLPPR